MNSYRSSQVENIHQMESQFMYEKPQTTNFQLLQPVDRSQTVLVNPHFQAKIKSNSRVFLNPNFSGSSSIHVNPRLKTHVRKTEAPVSKIHINPNVKNIQLPVSSQTVHINPKFTSAVTNILNSCDIQEKKENAPLNKPNKALVLTRTKLIRSHSPHRKLKRRNSVKSKYKIVKTGCSSKKSCSLASAQQGTHQNKYKIDNRINKSGLLNFRNPYLVKKYCRKYVINTRPVVGSPLVKANIKGNLYKKVKVYTTININGITYCKTRNSIQRTCAGIGNKIFLKDRSKKVAMNQSSTRRSIVKKFKVIRRQSPKKGKEKASPKRLKTCNIPCPFYRKYGVCRGKENGKCFWKHDPDQVALCTKFLQGACLKEKCLLAHNVSPEKMPTCKYYLEGACSRENCPYLHVKINPKADVCRDFLEGFCKKAAECDKRHQYLCPEYEKYGKCIKQRCAYPHGSMVRTYLMNKNKFVKKSSEFIPQQPVGHQKSVDITLKGEKCEEKQRYYAGNGGESSPIDEVGTDYIKNEVPLKTFVGLQSRPKLGSLPCFIPFKDNL
ncbi:zinc finger CCCH domain-containing protein 3 [Anthonomus grandis grandis]|uniref:zinc finger CCCH domain-containing protein 3 n=1 Tax=Anthonomus grandis grandis TaxID=2921223 RepID=UPI00216534F0|nr:zinc finger CCCH domain-containing protein 3 [Anthonomus grandis grandis]